MTPDRASRRRSLSSFGAVLLALNLLFRFSALLPPGRPASLFAPSLDAALLALLLCGYAWIAAPGARVFAGILAACALTLFCFTAADALLPLFFNRPFELYTDFTYLPDLYALLRDTLPGGLFYPGLLLLIAALAGLGFGLYLAFRFLQRAFRDRRYRYGFLALLAVLALLEPVPSYRFLANSALPRFAEEVAKLARRGEYARQKQQAFAAQVEQAETVRRPLDRLGGRDVYLFIIESYGYTLYSEPLHFRLIEAELQAFEAQAGEAGFLLCSAFLTSTAFGGNSWLADSTLASGVRIDNEAAYQLLLKSDVKPLGQFFNEAGYRTVVAMPATTYDWPEGEFYRFSRTYYYRDFQYQGPNFKWAPMTDQYVLDYIRRKEVSGARQPLFIQYVLISSHYPFNLIPKLYSDWSLIGDGSIYHRDDAVTVLPIKAGNQTAGPEGYAAAMAYELALIREYLKAFVPGEALVILIGDHQPYSGITGKNKPWSVPVHAISRSPELIEPFLKRGYTPGLVPDQPLPHAGMESFLPALLQDFSSQAPAGSPLSAAVLPDHAARATN